ncbi:hypothetical protein V6N11_040062 [Hibiscus sabdariffa]|uniref:RNase H type-1 domain-containing protein n=1 Tax=Hibiscus sabdariffa TaxID=183260 RepID=A0ABR2RGR3_9ROSI
MTNLERQRRGLSPISLCCLCSLHEESILRILRDCPSTWDTWIRILPRALICRNVGTPPEGWHHLNSDASVENHTSFSSVGGVFRSSEGAWLVGLHKAIGVASSLHDELWAIYIDLQLAWILGLEMFKAAVGRQSSSGSQSHTKAIWSWTRWLSKIYREIFPCAPSTLLQLKSHH